MTRKVKRHHNLGGQAAVTRRQRRTERAKRGSRPRCLTGGWYVVGLLSFRLFVWQGWEERVLLWGTHAMLHPHAHAHELAFSVSLALALVQARVRERESGESTSMVCVEASNSFFQHFLSRKNTLTLALLDHPPPPKRTRPSHTNRSSLDVGTIKLDWEQLVPVKNYWPQSMLRFSIKVGANASRFCIFYSTQKINRWMFRVNFIELEALESGKWERGREDECRRRKCVWEKERTCVFWGDQSIFQELVSNSLRRAFSPVSVSTSSCHKLLRLGDAKKTQKISHSVFKKHLNSVRVWIFCPQLVPKANQLRHILFSTHRTIFKEYRAKFEKTNGQQLVFDPILSQSWNNCANHFTNYYSPKDELQNFVGKKLQNFLPHFTRHRFVR